MIARSNDGITCIYLSFWAVEIEFKKMGGSKKDSTGHGKAPSTCHENRGSQKDGFNFCVTKILQRIMSQNIASQNLRPTICYLFGHM